MYHGMSFLSSLYSLYCCIYCCMWMGMRGARMGGCEARGWEDARREDGRMRGVRGARMGGCEACEDAGMRGCEARSMQRVPPGRGRVPSRYVRAAAHQSWGGYGHIRISMRLRPFVSLRSKEETTRRAARDVARPSGARAAVGNVASGMGREMLKRANVPTC